MTADKIIVVEILDGTNKFSPTCAGCSSGSCCGVSSDHEAAAMELGHKIEEVYGENVQVKYVNVDEVGIDEYPGVKKALMAGYNFPVTVINDKPRLAGGISLEQVKQILGEILAAN